jgi:hypothetical protein
MTATAPSPEFRSSGTHEIVTVGPAHADARPTCVYELRSGAWQPWSQIATQVGPVATATTLRMRHIAAERSGGGRIELFAVDATGMLYHAKQSNPNTPSWPTWAPLGFHLRAGNSLASP